MICLSDNDFLKKLAVCDLLSEAMDALETNFGEVYVLNTARHVLLKPLKKPEIAKTRLGEAVYERISQFLDRAQTLNVVLAPDEQRLFEDIPAIDPGEAVLFSATAHFPNCLLATGDKSCLRALAGNSNCQIVCQRLTNRVVCFEQVILRIIDRSGFTVVREKVIPAFGCDTALRAVFGSGLEATEETVRAGLTSYVTDLRRHTGALLVES